MTRFHQISVSEFELVSNQITYLFEQYNQINQFIKANFPAEYHEILARPEKDGSHLNWYSNIEGGLKSLDSFASDVRSRILAVYNARRHEIDSKCALLARSDDYDQQLWAGILRSAFNPDNILLFSNGTDIVLVWGIKTLNQKDYSIPFDQYKNFIVPVNPLLNSEINTGTPPPEEQITITEVEELVSPTSIESIEHTEALTPEIQPFSEVPEPEPEPEPEIITESNTPIEEGVRPDEDLIEEVNTPIIKELPTPKPRHWFYRSLDRVEQFFKRYWFFILPLLAIAIFLLLQNNWNSEPEFTATISDEEVEKRYDQIMPEEPRMRTLPVDTTKFRDDDSSGSVIVAGLLNIAMVDNKEKFKRMAVELKAAFPSDDFKIVYYDDQTHRVQLNFPEASSDTIKTSIRKKLSAYKLLLWDESVFRSLKLSNDPFWTSPSKCWHLKAINTEKAWDVSMGDTSVIVAVIDDGFDLNHPELKVKNIVKPYNVLTKNSRVFGNGRVQHGTHVASLAIGVAGNAAGASGIAPNCSFMPVQIGGAAEFFSSTDIIDGVLYALNNGADVINMSLGKMFGPELQSKSPSELAKIISHYNKDEEQFWNELFALAEQKNTLIVLAGGNESLLIGLDPMQRSSATLKVVALDARLQKASFSNYCKDCFGKPCFISAPGAAVYSAVPGNAYMPMDGTSMAAPIVTGAVALLKSVNARLKNQDILKILYETAKPSSDRSVPPLLQIDKAMQKTKTMF